MERSYYTGNHELSSQLWKSETGTKGLRYLGWMHTDSCKSVFLLLLDVTVRVYCGLTVLLSVQEHLPGSCQTSIAACTNICLWYVTCQPQFTFHFWKGFCSLIRATTSLSAGFHLQSSVQMECVIQDMEMAVWCISSCNPALVRRPSVGRECTQHPSKVCQWPIPLNAPTSLTSDGGPGVQEIVSQLCGISQVIKNHLWLFWSIWITSLSVSPRSSLWRAAYFSPPSDPSNQVVHRWPTCLQSSWYNPDRHFSDNFRQKSDWRVFRQFFGTAWREVRSRL